MSEKCKECGSIMRGNKCRYCCDKYENSFAYHIQIELNEPLEKYWDFEKNTLNPYLLSKKSHKKVWIKCIEKDYHGAYEVSCANFSKGKRCSYCGNHKIHPKDSFAQYHIDNTDEDFLIKYWSNKNTLNPWELSPKSAKKVWIKCQEKNYHNDYEIRCADFTNGSGCSYCGNHKVHPKDSFGILYSEKVKYWGDKNNISPYEVSPKSSKKCWFKCEKCNTEFKRSLSEINRYDDRGLYCKDCTSSRLEKITKDILDKYEIKYNTQKTFNGLVGLGKCLLSYDFYLPDYNILLECQGEQHEHYIKGFQRSKQEFSKQQEHDRRKFNYALEHNYIPMEIWYWDYDNIEEILIRELGLH